MKIEKSYFTATAFAAFMLLTSLSTASPDIGKKHGLA